MDSEVAKQRATALGEQAYLGRARSSRPAPPEDLRDFLILCHSTPEVITQGNFHINDLASGRVDLMARCVTAALFYSHGLRKQVRVWFHFVDQARTLMCDGASVRGLRPDERSIGAAIKRALVAAMAHSPEKTAGEEPVKRDSNGESKHGEGVCERGWEVRDGEDLAQLLRRVVASRETSYTAVANAVAAGGAEAGTAAGAAAVTAALAAALAMAKPPGGATASKATGTATSTMSVPTARGAAGAAGVAGRTPTLLVLHEEGAPLSQVLAKLKIVPDRCRTSVLHSSNPASAATSAPVSAPTPMAAQDGEYPQKSPAHTVMVLGDHIGLTATEESLLERRGAVRARMGALPLLSSQCILLSHFLLDEYALG